MLAKPNILAIAVAIAVTAPAAYAKSVNQQDYVKELFQSAKQTQVETLADAARKAEKLIGAAVSEGVLNSNEEPYLAILSQEFDYITPENSGKWGPLQPAPGEWDFSTHDSVVDYASLAGQLYKGHTLVWHSQMPSFITDDISAAQLSNYIDQHVQTTVSRYAGEFYGWDVVNEAIGDDGQFRDSVLYRKLGKDFISDAFYAVDALDKKARLYYNDYSIAGINSKSDAVYALMQDLTAVEVPVDGVGFQMHLDAANAPSYEEIVANFQRFADLDLTLAITELDVRIANLPWDEAANLGLQRQVYHNAVAACMAFKKCESITVWGITDKYSWIDTTFAPDDPLPYAEDYSRKAAYYGILDALTGIAPDAAGQLPNLIANGQFEGGAEGWTSWSADSQRVDTKAYLQSQKGTPNERLPIALAGESALLVSNRTENWSAAVVDITEQVRAGFTYDGALWLKLTNASADTATLSAKVVCDDGAEQYFNLASAAVTHDEWVALSGQLTVPECAITEASLYVHGPEAGTDFLIDAVSLRPEVLVFNTEGLGDNIVLNPDFESGNDYWYGFGPATVTATAAAANSGQQAGLVSNRADTWQGPAISIFEGAQSGTDYRVFASVRSVLEPATINATVKATCVSGDEYIYIASANATADSWTILSGEFSVPSCELSNLELYMEGPAAGVEFYIDDVNVRQILASAEESSNLVRNGDFENGIAGWMNWGGTLAATTGAQGLAAIQTGRDASWNGIAYNLLSTVVTGSEYTIAGDVRVAGTASESINITVKTVCADGATEYLWGGATTASDMAWTPLTGSVTLPNCELTEVTLVFGGASAGADILLDNVVVEGDTAEAPSNLVANSGFESGLDGWSFWGASLSLSLDANSGSQSAIQAGRTADWQGPVYDLLASVDAGGSYAISAFGKIAGDSSQQMNITVKTVCADGTTAYNYAGSAILSDSAWAPISGSLTLPECDLTEASLVFSGPAAGVDTLIDDVVVTAL